MAEMKRILIRVYFLFMKLKIATKFLLGYVIVIIVPTLLFGISSYMLNYKSVTQQYIANEQHALNISRENFMIRMEQIISSIGFFSSNRTLTSYLSETDAPTSDKIYNYIKNIRPVFDYVKSSNKYISHIRLYSYQELNFSVASQLNNIRDFEGSGELLEAIQKNLNGIWEMSADQNGAPKLSFYSSIYTDNYAKALGIIKIDVTVPAFFDSFSSLTNTLYFYCEPAGIAFTYSGGRLARLPPAAARPWPENFITQTIKLEQLNTTLVQALDLKGAISYDGSKLILETLFLFLLLTVFYYFIVTTITRRIVGLNNHILHSRADSLTAYATPYYEDEIGMLILSYNNIVGKVDELIHEVYQNELRRKDAEFYALQAQIKPHFLYNVLENIRMNAEQQQDTETADMILLLANYMRYNLNNSSTPVHLMDELQHARNYISIFRLRKKKSLNLKILALTEIDDVLCPRFILQPILENIMKHGLKEQTDIDIKIFIMDCTDENRESDIMVEIKDNGTGMSKDQLSNLVTRIYDKTYENDRHVGLRNINQRLMHYFGENYGIHMDSVLGSGTTVTLYLKRNTGGKHESIGN